jgi:hypothetical protein
MWRTDVQYRMVACLSIVIWRYNHLCNVGLL